MPSRRTLTRLLSRGLPAFCVALAALFAGRPARAFEDAEVRAMIAAPRDPADYPGAGGVWLGRERRIRIDGTGNAEIEEHLIAQVFDARWADARFRPLRRSYWSERTYLSVITARIWHALTEQEDLPGDAVVDSLRPEAAGFPSCSYYRERIFHFPPLKPGDRIELLLRWTLPVQPYNPNCNWFAEAFTNQDPVVEQRLDLLQPYAAGPRISELGPALLRRADSENGFRLRTWLTGNLKGRDRPCLATPWSRVPLPGDSLGRDVSQLLFTTFSDWQELGARYGRQWEHAWETRSPEMDRLNSEILNRSDDPVDHVWDCEDYVRDEIHTVEVPVPLLDLVPAPASDVMKDRAGTLRDKACLLTSLLRAAAITAYPVLLHDRAGAWDPDLPSPAQLDHYVVWARISGKEDLWLDPSGGAPPISPSQGLIFTGLSEDQDNGGPGGLVPFPGLTPEPAARRN